MPGGVAGVAGDAGRRTLASVARRVKWRRAWNRPSGRRHPAAQPPRFARRCTAQTPGDFPQPGSAGGEETAQQTARGQLHKPRLPVLGVAAQPLEDHGQLTTDHSFALAEQPTRVTRVSRGTSNCLTYKRLRRITPSGQTVKLCSTADGSNDVTIARQRVCRVLYARPFAKLGGVIHQNQVIAQRESFEHPFAYRIQPPSILDRTEPQPFLQPRRRMRPVPDDASPSPDVSWMLGPG